MSEPEALDCVAFALHVAEWAWEYEDDVASIAEALTKPNVLKSWRSMIEAKGKHSGDCTDEIHMCQTCCLDELRRQAKAIIEALGQEAE